MLHEADVANKQLPKRLLQPGLLPADRLREETVQLVRVELVAQQQAGPQHGQDRKALCGLRAEANTTAASQRHHLQKKLLDLRAGLVREVGDGEGLRERWRENALTPQLRLQEQLEVGLLRDLRRTPRKGVP